LEVSKLLSGWLNTLAFCRESKGRAYTMRSEVRAGRREGVERGVAAQVACTGGGADSGRAPDSGLVGARERTANMEPMLVTLEVSKLLSGWLNECAFCRESKGRAYIHDAERGAGREAGGRGAVAAQAACTERARLKAWGSGHERSAQRAWSPCS